MPFPGGSRKKGAYRCSVCSINYPVHVQFARCLSCEERTQMFSSADPHEDWLDRVVDVILRYNGGQWPAAPPRDWSLYGDPPEA